MKFQMQIPQRSDFTQARTTFMNTEAFTPMWIFLLLRRQETDTPMKTSEWAIQCSQRSLIIIKCLAIIPWLKLKPRMKVKIRKSKLIKNFTIIFYNYFLFLKKIISFNQ